MLMKLLKWKRAPKTITGEISIMTRKSQLTNISLSFHPQKIRQKWQKIKINDTKILIKKILTFLDEFNNFEIGLLFCDENTIQEMNLNYRSKDCPTDVLSFPWNSPKNDNIEEMNNYLGDIAICLPVAKNKAGEYKISINEELIRLIIHGILHLAGYDHETCENDMLIMEEKESFIYNEVKNYKIC
jgi:probable rRNA maturation factor